VRKGGELNGGRRCTVMWVFPHLYYDTVVHTEALLQFKAM